MSIEINSNYIDRRKRMCVDAVVGAVMQSLAQREDGEMPDREDIHDMVRAACTISLDQFQTWCNTELRLIEAHMERAVRLQALRASKPVILDL